MSNDESPTVDRRRFLKRAGIAGFSGSVLLSGNAVAKDKPVKVLTPPTGQFTGIDEAVVKLYPNNRVEYMVAGEGSKVGASDYMIGLENAQNSKEQYAPEQATVHLTQQSETNDPNRRQQKGNPNTQTSSESDGEVTAAATEAGAYCMIHDPPHYDLCRTRHTLDFICGGDADYAGRWYSATAWCPTEAPNKTCWKHDYNGFRYLHDRRVVESEVEAQYYNYNFLDNDNRTTAWTQVYLKGRPNCTWRWEVRWSSWGEASGLLHAHFGKY